MTSRALADRAISLLRDDSLQGRARQAADELRDLVEDGLTESHNEGLLRDFGTDPDSRPDLCDALTAELDRDSFFRAELARLVGAVLRTAKDPPQPPPTPSIRRDPNGNVIHDIPDDDPDPDPTSSFFRQNVSGLVLWAISAATSVALAFGGNYAYQFFTDWSAAGFMGEDTLCSEYLQANRVAQQEVMRQLFAEAGKYSRAGNPFAAIDTAQACAGSPGTALGAIVSRTR